MTKLDEWFPGRIRTVAERLREKQAEQLADWADLYFALGRASHASSLGHTAEMRAWLLHAEEIEYALLGSCNEVGSVVQQLDAVAGKWTTKARTRRLREAIGASARRSTPMAVVTEREKVIGLRVALARIAQALRCGHAIPGCDQDSPFEALQRSASLEEHGWHALAAEIVDAIEGAGATATVRISYSDGRYYWTEVPPDHPEAVRVSPAVLEVWRAASRLDETIENQLRELDNQQQEGRSP